LHGKLLSQIKEDLDYEKTHNKENYEIGEKHLSVVAREIHDRIERKVGKM